MMNGELLMSNNNNNEYGYDKETFGEPSSSGTNYTQDGYNNNYAQNNYNNNYAQNANNAQNGYNNNYNQNANYAQNGYNNNYNQNANYAQNGYNNNYAQGNMAYANAGAGYGAPNTLTLSQYTSKTFFYMFLGLILTFVTPYIISATPLGYYLYSNPALPMILLLVELFLVIILSRLIHKLSVGAAFALFFGYAFINGVTFSSIFILYSFQSLIFIFAMASLYFGALAAYGYFTKRDLSGLAPILSAGLIVMMVFWVLSLFLNLSGLDTIMCVVGLAIFMGLTAYDMQKIKTYYNMYGSNPEMAKKASIISALQLYLDFINIFLYLLRLFGKRK